MEIYTSGNGSTQTPVKLQEREIEPELGYTVAGFIWAAMMKFHRPCR